MVSQVQALLGEFWGCNSVGRVPALQAGSQEFNPPQLHLVPVAQLEEHSTFNRVVKGSSPFRHMFLKFLKKVLDKYQVCVYNGFTVLKAL